MANKNSKRIYRFNRKESKAGNSTYVRFGTNINSSTARAESGKKPYNAPTIKERRDK